MWYYICIFELAIFLNMFINQTRYNQSNLYIQHNVEWKNCYTVNAIFQFFASYALNTSTVVSQQLINVHYTVTEILSTGET